MRKRVLMIVALVWVVGPITVSLQSFDRVGAGTEPPAGTKGLPVWEKPMRHRISHFIAFAVAGALLSSIAPGSRKAPWAWVEPLLAATAAWIMGLTIEIAQMRVFKLRVLEWWDLRDDAIGVAIAMCGWLLWRWLDSSRRKGQAAG